jgi:hypothetical protein
MTVGANGTSKAKKTEPARGVAPRLRAEVWGVLERGPHIDMGNDARIAMLEPLINEIAILRREVNQLRSKVK